MAWRYTWRNFDGGTDCYKSAVMHARMLAQKKGIPILIVYNGKQSGRPRNMTADPRKVSHYVLPNGDSDFAKTPDGFYVEPMGCKGLTWTE
jgi:hypothetical protein